MSEDLKLEQARQLVAEAEEKAKRHVQECATELEKVLNRYGCSLNVEAKIQVVSVPAKADADNGVAEG